jgi:hypothetical protein
VRQKFVRGVCSFHSEARAQHRDKIPHGSGVLSVNVGIIFFVEINISLKDDRTYFIAWNFWLQDFWLSFSCPARDRREKKEYP